MRTSNLILIRACTYQEISVSLRVSFIEPPFSWKKRPSSNIIRDKYQNARIDKKRANLDRMANNVVLIEEQKDKREFVKKFNSNMVVGVHEQVK